MHLIVSKCEHLYESLSFVSLLVWSIQVRVNTMPRRKDISNEKQLLLLINLGGVAIVILQR